MTPTADECLLAERGDCPQFIPVLEAIRITRLGPGRPRPRRDRALADMLALRYGDTLAHRHHQHLPARARSQIF
jgi:hypothetical protein